MRSTHFAIVMGEINHKAYKCHERLIGYLDSAQWMSAASELGRLEELGNQMATCCRLAYDAMREDEFVHKQRDD